jgi:membrane protein implicated in regulation of membrane protease activity
MSTQTKSGGGTLWFLPALTLVFVAAKLFGHFDHSWWWVFAPMWIPWALVLVIMGLWGLLYLGALGVFAIRTFVKYRSFQPYKKARDEQKKNKEVRKSIERYANSLTRRS